MKAIVRDKYGTPDDLRFEEKETPVAGDDEVVVEVHAASLNTADLDGMRGYPFAARIGTGLFNPKISVLGLDVAGTVRSVGKDVTLLAPGDQVWADMSMSGCGAFAEYVCAPEKAFNPKPAGLTFEDAATVPHSGLLALQGLRGRGPITPGQRVLIIGAGGCVGPFAVQIARSFGAEVTGVDHPAKLDMLRSLGVDHIIDYTREDVTKNGQRYDLILDIAGHRAVLAYRRSLTPDGRYVLIAGSLARFFQAALLGAAISLGGSKKMGVFMWRPNRREDLELVAELIQSGKIKPLIDKRIELAAVPEAFRYLQEGHARGKVVVTS